METENELRVTFVESSEYMLVKRCTITHKFKRENGKQEELNLIPIVDNALSYYDCVNA